MTIKTKAAAAAPYLLSLLRIVIALLFIEHGTTKLFGFPPSAQSAHLTLFSLGGLSGVLELIGGLFLLPGLFTRPVAFILSGEMAVAYFLVHAPKSFFPVLNMGEPAIVYAFVFLFFAAAGAGPWSLDARLEGREEVPREGAAEQARAQPEKWRKAA